MLSGKDRKIIFAIMCWENTGNTHTPHHTHEILLFKLLVNLQVLVLLQILPESKKFKRNPASSVVVVICVAFLHRKTRKQHHNSRLLWRSELQTRRTGTVGSLSVWQLSLEKEKTAGLEGKGPLCPCSNPVLMQSNLSVLFWSGLPLGPAEPRQEREAYHFAHFCLFCCLFY